MRILVSIPAVSHKMAKRCDGLFPFHNIESFYPKKLQNLDIFADEFADVRPEKFFGINVPHWPLREREGRGVAGPGLPTEELFHPPSLRGRLFDQARTYDKWRPYPAQRPLSSYNVSMARKYAGKRCRMFAKVAEDMRWENLVYVEHSPASLAHLSRKEARDIADRVIRLAVEVGGGMPYADLVIFSPYGIGGDPGFVVSNRIDPKRLRSWGHIKEYLEGQYEGR